MLLKLSRVPDMFTCLTPVLLKLATNTAPVGPACFHMAVSCAVMAIYTIRLIVRVYACSNGCGLAGAE